MNRNNIDKIISKASEDPDTLRLIQIGESVKTLEKEKSVLKANKEKLDKKEKNAKLAEINTQLSELKTEKDAIKKGEATKTRAEPVVEPKTEEVDAPPDPVNETAVAPEQPADIIVNEEKADEQEPAEVTTVDNEKTPEIEGVERERRQTYIEAIKLGKEMGQSKEALVGLGIDRNLVDEIYDAEEEPAKPTADKEKSGAFFQQIMQFMENERKEEEEYELERQKDLEQIEADEKKLAELVALREQLVAQENVENGSDDASGGEGAEGGEDSEKGSDESDEEVVNIEKLQSELDAKNEEIEKLQKEVNVLDGINYSDELWQNIKSVFNPSWWKRDIKIGKLNKKIKALNVERSFLQGKLDAKEIKLDEENRPFLYFTAGKVENPTILKILNRTYGTTDLRWAKWITPEEDNFEVKNRLIQKTGENEGFFEFNIFGFTKILKNVNEMLVEEDGKKFIASYSPESIYKIVGPDGTIIADNIKGYDEATKVYDDATEKYKEKVEEEWNKLNNK